MSRSAREADRPQTSFGLSVLKLRRRQNRCDETGKRKPVRTGSTVFCRRILLELAKLRLNHGDAFTVTFVSKRDLPAVLAFEAREAKGLDARCDVT